MNEVLAQLHARKSVRAFADTPVPPEVKRAVLEAACAAPTASARLALSGRTRPPARMRRSASSRMSAVSKKAAHSHSPP